MGGGGGQGGLRPAQFPPHCLQVLQRNRTIPSNPDPPSAAILVVYLDRAEELPVRGGPGNGGVGRGGAPAAP